MFGINTASRVPQVDEAARATIAHLRTNYGLQQRTGSLAKSATGLSSINQCVVGSFFLPWAAGSASTRSIRSMPVSFGVASSTICNTAVCGVDNPSITHLRSSWWPKGHTEQRTRVRVRRRPHAAHQAEPASARVCRRILSSIADARLVDLGHGRRALATALTLRPLMRWRTMQRIGADGGCGNRLRNLCGFGIFGFLHALKRGLPTTRRQRADLATFQCPRPQAQGSISSIRKALMVDCYSVAIAWQIEAQW